MNRKLVILDLWNVLIREKKFFDYLDSKYTTKFVKYKKKDLINLLMKWEIDEFEFWKRVTGKDNIDFINTLIENHTKWYMENLSEKILDYLNNCGKRLKNVDIILFTNVWSSIVDKIKRDERFKFVKEIFASYIYRYKKPDPNFCKIIYNFLIDRWYRSVIYIDDKNENIQSFKQVIKNNKMIEFKWYRFSLNLHDEKLLFIFLKKYLNE